MSMCVSSFAAVSPAPANAIAPRWQELDRIAGSLKISASGRATFTASAASVLADAVEIEISLQQDGEEIKSWSAYADFNVVDKSGTWYVDKGHHYQIVITAYVYIGGEIVDSGEKTIEYGNF